MAASYPASVKSFTTKVDNVDDVEAAHINSVQEEIVAIETALGANMVNAQGIKAWVDFDGTGTPAINDSFNTSASITDLGTGKYTISWTTAFASADYALCCSHTYAATTAAANCSYQTKAAGSVNIYTGDNSGALNDYASVSVIAIGD